MDERLKLVKKELSNLKRSLNQPETIDLNELAERLFKPLVPFDFFPVYPGDGDVQPWHLEFSRNEPTAYREFFTNLCDVVALCGEIAYQVFERSEPTWPAKVSEIWKQAWQTAIWYAPLFPAGQSPYRLLSAAWMDACDVAKRPRDAGVLLDLLEPAHLLPSMRDVSPERFANKIKGLLLAIAHSQEATGEDAGQALGKIFDKRIDAKFVECFLVGIQNPTDGRCFLDLWLWLALAEDATKWAELCKSKELQAALGKALFDVNCLESDLEAALASLNGKSGQREESQRAMFEALHQTISRMIDRISPLAAALVDLPFIEETPDESGDYMVEYRLWEMRQIARAYREGLVPEFKPHPIARCHIDAADAVYVRLCAAEFNLKKIDLGDGVEIGPGDVFPALTLCTLRVRRQSGSGGAFADDATEESNLSPLRVPFDLYLLEHLLAQLKEEGDEAKFGGIVQHLDFLTVNVFMGAGKASRVYQAFLHSRAHTFTHPANGPRLYAEIHEDTSVPLALAKVLAEEVRMEGGALHRIPSALDDNLSSLATALEAGEPIVDRRWAAGVKLDFKTTQERARANHGNGLLAYFRTTFPHAVVIVEGMEAHKGNKKEKPLDTRGFLKANLQNRQDKHQLVFIQGYMLNDLMKKEPLPGKFHLQPLDELPLSPKNEKETEPIRVPASYTNRGQSGPESPLGHEQAPV